MTKRKEDEAHQIKQSQEQEPEKGKYWSTLSRSAVVLLHFCISYDSFRWLTTNWTIIITGIHEAWVHIPSTNGTRYITGTCIALYLILKDGIKYITFTTSNTSQKQILRLFLYRLALQFRTADLCALETARVTRKRCIGRFMEWDGSQSFLGGCRIHWCSIFQVGKCKAFLSFRFISIILFLRVFFSQMPGIFWKNNSKRAFNLQQTRLQCHFNLITLLRSKSLGADRREVWHLGDEKYASSVGGLEKCILRECLEIVGKNGTKIIYPISHSQWKDKLHHSKKLA